MSDVDYWAWVEPEPEAESRGFYCYRDNFTSIPGPTFRPGLIFQSWNNAALSVGGAAIGSQSRKFDVVADATSGSGGGGSWGWSKRNYVYLRQEAGVLNIAIIDTTSDLVADWSTADLLSLSGYTGIGAVRFVPPYGYHIAFTAIPPAGTRKHLYFISSETGAIEADLDPADFESNPYETADFAGFAVSSEHLAVWMTSTLPPTEKLLIFSRVTGAFITQHNIGFNNYSPRFSDDETILYWQYGNVLKYIDMSDPTTLVSQNEFGTNSHGDARFWDQPALAPDNSFWANSYGYRLGGISGTYHSYLHTMDSSFAHLDEANIGAFGSTTYEGDLDETGLWWFGGLHNINGDDKTWVRDPFATANHVQGSGRASHFYMRPFQPR